MARQKNGSAQTGRGGDRDILSSAAISRRRARAPDLAAENEALHSLARLLIDKPASLPKRLAEVACELCRAGSAGVSLLEETAAGAVFRWTALAGRLAPHEGGSTPRDRSPCGLCLDRGEAILIADPARRFEYFNEIAVPIVEGLIVPLFGAGKRALGTLWIVSHTRSRRFGRGDLRAMTRLADFTALAVECAGAQASLRDDERRSRELLEALPVALYTTDAAGRITYLNQAAADLAGRRPQLGHDRWCVTWRLFRPDGTPLPHEECPMAVALKENRPVRGEEVVAERPDGTRIPLIPHPTPLHDASGALAGAVNVVVDISERKRAETFLVGQRRILEMVAIGTPRDAVLDNLMRLIESQEPGMIAGLLLTDDGVHFRPGSGPSLPAAYREGLHEALETIAITAPYFGTCAEAVHCGRTTLVADVAGAERYAGPWRDLMLASGLRAIRSTPVRGSDGRIIGCLALYFSQMRNPDPANSELVDMATHLAAIVIERARAESELRTKEERLAAELAAALRLQQTSTRLLQEGDTDALYGQILDTAVAITHSDKASMQMLDPERNVLRLLAWRGFDPAAAAGWEWVSSAHHTSCAEALRTGRRVVVPDVASCHFMHGTPDLDAYSAAGIRAVQSTPLISRSGRLLGMISTHWTAPHRSSEDELRLLDVLARQAADLIERNTTEAALRELNAALEGRVAARTQELADANQRLRRERLLSELIVENAAEGIIVVDNQMRYLVWNAAMERINGLPRNAVLAKTVFEVFAHLSDHPIGRAWRDALAGRRTESRDRRYFSPARDQEIVYDADHAPLFDRAGTILGAVCIVRETTERHLMEEMLRQSQRLEAVAQLTGGVAHDFNNLLTVISGHAEALAAALKEPRLVPMAAAIQRAADRGARLTGQLLAFSRRQALQPAPIDFERLTHEIDALVRRAAGETIEVEFRSDPGLWPTLADPGQFESALLNLAVNARDAMPQGGRLVIAARNVSIAGAEAARLELTPGDYIVVRVSDTGTGMPTEVRDHAFEPFFTTKDVGKGTGLGLAQIYGFVKQSGGAATIESTMGSGTAVSLYLPRAAAETVADEPPRQTAMPSPGDGKTILVVEDQPDVRDVIEALLADLGYNVLTAADGVDARRMLDSGTRIDLLLTDLVMPNGVSGLDLAETARRLRQDLKIVLVSGYSRDAQIRMRSSDGGFVFLEKPFRQAELAKSIAAALGTGP